MEAGIEEAFAQRDRLGRNIRPGTDDAGQEVAPMTTFNQRLDVPRIDNDADFSQCLSVGRRVSRLLSGVPVELSCWYVTLARSNKAACGTSATSAKLNLSSFQEKAA